MLKQLYIKNFTLIDEERIDFGPGFSVITGETGAGKSIILGAIGLLLGNRAGSKAVRAGADRCVIEAHFDLTNYAMGDFFSCNDIDEDLADTIIRRELSAAGKSRAFINDTPVSLFLMRELGEQLVDIHSQHQNLLLQKEDFQLNVVDIIAADGKALDDYHTAYARYRKTETELDALKRQIEEARTNEDFLRFQYNELAKAALEEGEQEELEQEGETLAHAEEIKTALFEADSRLNGDDGSVVGSIKQAVRSLHDIEEVYPKVRELAERLDSSLIELKDISAEVSSATEAVDFDPTRLDAINSRLDAIYSLQQKFHVSTVAELLAMQGELKNELDNVELGSERIDELEARLATDRGVCEERAARLTALRTTAARKVEAEMLRRLVPLGIPNVRFEVQIERRELSPTGGDKVAFLFSANKSTALQPVQQVASGGEIARVMLSLKAMVSGTVKLPTIIFDEIDTGVSGRVAEKMAQIMQEMGDSHRQVLSITHLPQIAALGTTHYKVSKEETAQGTLSHMRMLTTEERVTEIAQMLSGSDVTVAAMENARQLLKLDK